MSSRVNRLKAYLVICGLAFAMTFVAGCKTNGVAPPLAPGYQNAVDQQLGQTLAGANWFYTSVQCSTTGHAFSQATHACDPSVSVQPYVPGPSEKTALNDLSLAINAANGVYLSYHNGTATQAQAQTAINNVALKQASAEAVVPQSVGVR